MDTIHKHIHLKKLMLALALLSGCAKQSNSPYCDQESNCNLIINGVNVVDVATKKVIKNQRVTVKQGVITNIQSMAESVENTFAKQVDANGGYITPGLIDMHVHAYDKGAFELSLSHGVTHVRVMNGIKQHIQWREAQKSGWLASSMSVSSPIIGSGEPQPLNWMVNSIQEAKMAVQKAKEMGYDLIKVYGNISKPSLGAVLDEAEKLAIPVAKHGPHPVSGMEWDSLRGLQSLEHVEDIFQGPLDFQFDHKKLEQAISQLKRTKTPVTPTLNVFWQLSQLSLYKESFIDELPINYISPIIAWEAKNNQVARWINSSGTMVQHNQEVLAFLKLITKELNEHEIPLLVGSDAGVLLSPHGIATHNELKLLKESGLNEFSILQAATLRPAVALGMGNVIGQVREGFNADFIFTRSDPTVDVTILSSPEAVIKRGRWLSKGDLKLMRKRAQESRSWWSELLVLLTNY